ncbi:MAG: hypothetical protein M1429_00720 [Patescibacteria group bacterium]|nr:hypothetical protein [Patescibacteria group bacterium]
MPRQVKELSPLTTREGKVSEVEVPVVSPEEWKRKRDQGAEIVATISEHLQFERALQDRRLNPKTLCSEQQATLVSDLDHVVGGVGE